MKHKNKVTPHAATPKQDSRQVIKTSKACLSNSEGSLLDSKRSHSNDQRPCSAPIKEDGPATGVVISCEGEVELGLVEIHDSFSG